MNALESEALRRVQSVWTQSASHLVSLNSHLGISHKTGEDVFEIEVDRDFPDDICFKVKPVAFKLPEKATSPHNLSLFVILQGRVTIDRPSFREGKLLQIKSFSTEVAYFRKNSSELKHVFGAHFDTAPTHVGHPAYHGQLKSYYEWYDLYKASSRVLPANCTVIDGFGGVLSNVRIPSAHMDIFSYLLQLGADHLVTAKSSREELRTFEKLRIASLSLKGSAHLLSQFSSAVATTCLRSPHWYPIS
ncbi:hypothetical protein [Burkholderia gladioli]|uniref:hypothetical protein n=1 Tax=Burkholderia gladioli TaxID=28095 RepID=UPI003D361C0D